MFPNRLLHQTSISYKRHIRSSAVQQNLSIQKTSHRELTDNEWLNYELDDLSYNYLPSTTPFSRPLEVSSRAQTSSAGEMPESCLHGGSFSLSQQKRKFVSFFFWFFLGKQTEMRDIFSLLFGYGFYCRSLT